jgi:UDP:flavonoid glycosyltransferase YjiC (YdhE family)
MSEAEVAGRVMADPDFVLEQILLPSLATSTCALEEIASGADALVASIFAFAGGIIAEKLQLPFVPVVLQPMTLFSVYQPPRAPRFGIMRHEPRTSLGRAWNAGFYFVAKHLIRGRYSSRIDEVRREHGLPPSTSAPLFEQSAPIAATLCCWSPVLSSLPPDAPPFAKVVGFPFFDSHTGGDDPLPVELEQFLADGEPPLVFTLGSVAVLGASGFYGEAAAAANALGRRAVLLIGGTEPAQLEKDCLFMSYAQHSLLFPRAAAVIHHGGIGTSGQALRAGRPQVVLPHFGDQFDNAERLRSLGVARIVRRNKFRKVEIAGTLRGVLDSADIIDAALRAREAVMREDGAKSAATRIMSLVRDT